MKRGNGKPWRRGLVAVGLVHALGSCTVEQPWTEPVVLEEEAAEVDAVAREEAESALVEATHALSCEDILPEGLGPSRTVILRANGPEAFCGPGVGNGSGVLALRNDGPFGVVAWSLVSPEGIPFGRSLIGGQFGSTLLPHRRGFHLLIDGFQPSLRLQAYSSEGEFLRQTPLVPATIEAVDVAVNPQGGTVAAWWSVVGSDSQTRNLLVQSFDERGRPRASPRVVQTVNGSESLDVLVGVDLRGRILVLWHRSGTGAWTGQWLRQDGTARTQPFPALEDSDPSPSSPDDRLQPLVGEGLVLRLAGQWLRQFPSNTPTSLPAPGWLAAHPGTELALIRNNHAYALVPPATDVEESGCREQVNLFTRDGEPCGELVFPFGGSVCSRRQLGIGLDGTVIQQIDLNIPANDQCAWRWWPRLLR